jgi:hypothetical protein
MNTGPGDPILLADGERAQAQAARPVALRALAMRGVSVLRRALRPAHLVRDVCRNACVSKSGHRRSS